MTTQWKMKEDKDQGDKAVKKKDGHSTLLRRIFNQANKISNTKLAFRDLPKIGVFVRILLERSQKENATEHCVHRYLFLNAC